MVKKIFKPVTFLVIACLLFACQGSRVPRQEVVVYTSVDQVYAEPVLKAFEAKSGIRVLAVYDVEATKTVGLAQRLLAEKGNPQADVFWSGEFTQTMFLNEQGILAQYRSPAAADLPAEYADPDGYWYAFGGRARVILVNTKLVGPGEEPASIFDLLAERYPAHLLALANPLFGTTSTQAAALYAVNGADASRSFYQQVAERGVRVVDGNSVVREMVANGQLAWGLTDSDDACYELQKGAPVKVVFPDQAEGQIGTLVIPNTVALIANAPHPENGQALVDYLLTPQAEALMVELGWIQFPARPLPQGLEPACFAGVSLRGMSPGLEEIYQYLAAAQVDMQEIFVR
ncbi:MAG: extracellular solute-binding protein [Kiritimatiellota bacterium]|nr:extracellular solute-binding protein [Kiritimatiellota bacterium]